MQKKTKAIIDIVLVLGIIISFVWGTIIRGLGNWGTRSYSTWWSDDIFWANTCQIIIPILLVGLLIFINKRK